MLDDAVEMARPRNEVQFINIRVDRGATCSGGGFWLYLAYDGLYPGSRGYHFSKVRRGDAATRISPRKTRRGAAAGAERPAAVGRARMAASLGRTGPGSRDAITSVEDE